MAGDVADPIALAPDAWADADLGVEVNGHLEVSLEDGFGDGELAGGGGVALEAGDHGFVVAFLGGFDGGLDGSAVDGLM